MTPIEQLMIALVAGMAVSSIVGISLSLYLCRTREPFCPICGNKNHRVESSDFGLLDGKSVDTVFSCGYAVDDEGQSTSFCDSDLHTRTQRNMIRHAH